uniref:(northern house mosquito) hypothetical protein n=1 Tax=Culex pipiens TaxID=7175 RepID=A0A8D8CQ83_CULPI
MPCVRKICRAARERERKKKLIRALEDPLAWTFQDPWRNPQEFAIAVLPGSGAANEEDGTPSSVATTQGSSQETSPSPRPAFCPPQLVTPDKLKPNGDPDRFPRDAAGEDGVTPNCSTRSAIFLPQFLTPDKRSDQSGKNQSYMDWQIQEANSFNMEIFPMDVESDEIREGSVVFAGPSVPDIAASEINLPTRVTTNENALFTTSTVLGTLQLVITPSTVTTSSFQIRLKANLSHFLKNTSFNKYFHKTWK